MIRKLLFFSIATVTTFTITACVPNTQQGQYQTSTNNGNYGSPIASNSNTNGYSTLSPTLTHTLEYMYHEERLAKDIYLNIYKTQPIKQLYNIATKAETRHIDAVHQLANKYGVAGRTYPNGQYPDQELQSLYNKLYAKGVRSKRDALEVGCMVEVVDINDLNRYIGQAQAANAQDILSTFNFLRKGSYNHYWAFDRSLKKEGVSNGCCSLGQVYCHPEYPQNSKGHGGEGKGQGRGNGQGRGAW